jgi:hypothetical protein
MARTNRSGRNNNPSGRNQYSSWGVMEMARGRPVAAAAATVGAAAAGLFLWSKRAQISEQLSSLSNQIGEWREGLPSGDGFMARGNGTSDQSDIAEEALTLKQTGKRPKRPANPTVDAQTKASAIA